MTALSDALAAAQARVVAVLAKSYVQGRVDREAAELMLAVEQWFASLDVIREHGGQAPSESRSAANNEATEAQWKLIRRLADEQSAANNEATEAQWKLIRRLADEQHKTAPEGPLTKEHASRVIEQLKAGTYNPDDWTVIPL